MKAFFLCLMLLAVMRSRAQNPGSIPDSIRNYTILVMKAEEGIIQKHYNKGLEKAFGQYYKGSFELVGKKELEESRYADLKKHRYTLTYYQTGKFRSQGPLGNQSLERDVPIMDVVFHDRLSNRDLELPGIQSTTYPGALRKLGKMLAHQ